MNIRCDICGSELVMLVGGKSAACKNCGMEHSVERIREMLNIKAVSESKYTAASTSDTTRNNQNNTFAETKLPVTTERKLTESTDSDFILKKKLITTLIKDYKGNAQRVIIPKNVNTISAKNPLASHNEIEELIFPSYIGTEDDDAFAGMKNLKKVLFHSDPILMTGTFRNCVSLEEVVFTNAGSISLGWDCFAGCVNLKKFEVNESATLEFSPNLFKDCKSLRSFVSPEHCDHQCGEGIKSSVFENCTALDTVVLPKNTIAIHKDAFRNCTSLKSVTVRNGSLNDLAIHPDAFKDSSFVPEKVGVCPKCGGKLTYSEATMTCSSASCDFRTYEY